MKNTILTIGILSVMTLTVSAQNQIPSPRYGASVVEFEVDSATQAWAHFLLFGKTELSQNPFEEAIFFKATNESTGEFTSITPNWDSTFFSYGQTALNFNNEYIVIVGGVRTDSIGNQSSNSNALIYDVANETIIYGNLEPFPSKGFMAHSDIGQGKIFFNGGYMILNGLKVSYSHTFVLDMNTMTFTTKQSCPKELSGHKAISDTVNHKTYLFGGLDNNGNNNFECYEYNHQNNSWGFGPSIQNYPQNEWTAFGATGSTLNPNEIFIAGGQKYSPNKSTNSISFSTNIYTIKVNNGNLTAHLITNNLPPMIGAAAWCSLESNNDTVFYFFGGINSITTTGDTTITNNFYRFNQTTSQIQQYDTTQQTWGGIVSSINDAEFKTSVELTVFPNPTTDKVSFALQTKETIKNIKIFNQNGQLIQQISNPTETQINFTHKTSGLYFIRIDTEKNYYLGKVIKQ